MSDKLKPPATAPMMVSVPTPVVRMKAPIVNVPEIKVPPVTVPPVDMSPVAGVVAELGKKIDALIEVVGKQQTTIDQLTAALKSRKPEKKARAYSVEVAGDDGETRRLTVVPQRSN